MCGRNPSQKPYCSQMESLPVSFVPFSSFKCPYLIRDKNGTVFYFSPQFQNLSKNLDPIRFLSTLSLSIKTKLVDSELRLISDTMPCIVSDVFINNEIWSVFIEHIHLESNVFTRWVFIPVDKTKKNESHFFRSSENRGDCIVEMEKYMSSGGQMSERWKVFNLYAIGLTERKISELTGLSQDQVKKLKQSIKNDCCITNLDNLILNILSNSRYEQLASNVASIVKPMC